MKATKFYPTVYAALGDIFAMCLTEGFRGGAGPLDAADFMGGFSDTVLCLATNHDGPHKLTIEPGEGDYAEGYVEQRNGACALWSEADAVQGMTPMGRITLEPHDDDGVLGETHTYLVQHPGEREAGILPYTEEVTVHLAHSSGAPADFFEHILGSLQNWFDGASIGPGKHCAFCGDDGWVVGENQRGEETQLKCPVCGNESAPAYVNLEADFAKLHAGFMEPQVEYGEYFQVETTHGTETVPADVVNRTTETISPEELLHYLEGTPLDMVTPLLRLNGWLARLSAPGYMDCTPWSVHETECEAKQYLVDMYGE